MKEIDGQRDENAEMECDPKPNTGGHRGRRFHVADAAAMPIAIRLCVKSLVAAVYERRGLNLALGKDSAVIDRRYSGACGGIAR